MKKENPWKWRERGARMTKERFLHASQNKAQGKMPGLGGHYGPE